MPITSGSTIRSDDFIDNDERNATPANDEGRGIKLESDAKIHPVFLRGSFGGTGADGVLSIAAGTTTIDCLGAAVVIKNYTSISITGTGALAFSNPHTNGTLIIFRVQGNVTITSSAAIAIDLRSMGATGGSGFSGASGAGTDGTKANGILLPVNGGGGGPIGGTGTGGVGFNPNMTMQQVIYGRSIPLHAGSGGGGGGTSVGSVGGAGGRGAGGLYIECAGALNFTSPAVVSIAGTAGSNGSGGTNSGGGGGGAGGCFIVLYKTLTANTGTVTTTGGAGGTGTGTGCRGGGGANIGSGSDATSTNGGAGATGVSLIAANADIV